LRTNNYRRPQQAPRHITNERILGDEFRVIDDKGEQIGILSRVEALQIAKDRGVELVLIAPKAQPPVVKVIDYHKFLYQEEKKLKESRKGQKKGGAKDIQLSLFAGEGDMERFRKKTLEFLADGFQVRVKMPLFGRQMEKRGMAIETIKAFIASLGEVTVAVEPKMQGRVVFGIVVRKK
jgi:translation initiation factor IF-3